jgi:uncharacterized protein YjiS (DUF1127 family)
MSTIALRAPSAISSFFHKLGHDIQMFMEGIREANEIAARYEALSRLSDAELARRGITRTDIPRIALKGYSV